MASNQANMTGVLTGAHKALKADTIPKPRVFLMGNGKPVQPKRAKEFCAAIVDKCLDDAVHGHSEFALGFAACFDAIARGTIGLEEHPVNVMNQAYSDVHNITTKPNKVTDIMRLGD
jgi:hypothetical protein